LQAQAKATPPTNGMRPKWVPATGPFHPVEPPLAWSQAGLSSDAWCWVLGVVLQIFAKQRFLCFISMPNFLGNAHASKLF
jgi:hypothetical protein